MMEKKNGPLMIYIAEPIWQCIKVKKWKDTAQQYIRKYSFLMNKETIYVFEMYTRVKKV